MMFDTNDDFCSFFIIVGFVLLSMIMAIIMGSYDEVRSYHVIAV